MYKATELDIKRATEIVKEVYAKYDKTLSIKHLNTIVIDIMETSYSIGGDYSDECIRSIAKSFVLKEL